MKKLMRSVVVVGFAVGIVSAIWFTTAMAQDAAPVARVGDDEAGRLPPGYTVVVTKSQRSKIYAIQDTYQKQLDDLKKQIAQIESKRDQEIESILDEEQKKIIAYVLKLRERERQPEPDTAQAGN
ncbi:MAG: hypothetical protein H6822_00755 [Planctomycetaceae bacterium]|nr:hypothetical protein [Planctomycetales bacterium]MCB9920674.1 hypothetical protein [Planctomycetaceae bacterium]